MVIPPPVSLENAGSHRKSHEVSENNLYKLYFIIYATFVD